LPSTVTEDEFVRVVERVADRLWFKFGRIHGSREDYSQEISLWALQAMPKYDASRPLDGYLFRVARNMSMNWIRDHITRTDFPCSKCHSGTPCGEDGACCRRYKRWKERNTRKAAIARPVGLDKAVDLTRDSTVEDEVAGCELAQLIDRHLPVELRADYLRMLAGTKPPVPLHRREKVQQAVADILAGKYTDLPDDTVEESDIDGWDDEDLDEDWTDEEDEDGKPSLKK
jgi:DNA-directed RNA polymerase specialized sigma24 family protein